MESCPPGLPQVWDRTHHDLDINGYAVLEDHEIGITAPCRDHIRRTFFTPDILRRYACDMPADRERARDVIRYSWLTGGLDLREHDTVTIENRGTRAGRREFDRVRVLRDPVFDRWIRTVLHLVPPRARRPRGTFGVNLFRTFTNVVTEPHQDHEEYILVYVVTKVGGGGITQLFDVDTREVVFKEELQPGQLIMFRDDRFRHSTTPLIEPHRGAAYRDALVCTVDYQGTYPLAGAAD